MNRKGVPSGLLILFMSMIAAGSCEGGMPALLPTDWTADKPAPPWAGSSAAAQSGDAHWQAISFFLACLFVSAWGVKSLWNSLRRDFTRLPELRYGRSLSLVVLWGLCFVVVLTMISGARELMTPGAWRKQGWTYTLADAKPVDTSDARRQGLERLRFALWHFAATHEGQFPSQGDPAVDPRLWEIPGGRGVRFLYVAGQSTGKAGKLLIYEPELNGDERLVLLTNGFVGTMRTAEIEQLLTGDVAP